MKRGRMDQVARVAKVAEQQSAREMTEIRSRHDQQCAQLAQLLQFKSDYEENLDKLGGAGMAAKQLQDYRLFLSKLGEAIAAQEREVEAARASLEQVRAQWLSKSQRTSALDHLVDEQARNRLQAREKARQKESDDDALARHLRD